MTFDFINFDVRSAPWFSFLRSQLQAEGWKSTNLKYISVVIVYVGKQNFLTDSVVTQY